MTVIRNTGTDLLPLHATRPSYPGARLRAMRDARARRERENTQQPFDADRLARDLDARPPDVRVNDGDGDEATRAYLQRMGWTNDRLDRATADLRDNLQRRVHPSPTTNVTAGAIGPLSGTPAPAVASGRQGRTARDLAGMAGNIAAARRAGLDPAKLWPGQAGLPGRPSPPRLVAAAGPERTIYGLLPPVGASSSPFPGSTTSGPVRRALGGRERCRP
jgi:hypothetical protein